MFKRKFLKFLILIMTLSLTSAYAKRFGTYLCGYQGFTCVKIKQGQTWYSLFPDEYLRDIVMRLNRMNTQVYPGIQIVVPNNLEYSDMMSYSPFPLSVHNLGEKVVVVDPLYQAWAAYDADGNLVRWGPASAGEASCHDIEGSCSTHPGVYRIYSLGDSECYSTKFPLPDGGAPMPYCMYFNGGQALHGEPNGLPGYNASHGCVRMYVNDAEWLRYDFVEGPTAQNKYKGTRVIVRPY